MRSAITGIVFGVVGDVDVAVAVVGGTDGWFVVIVVVDMDNMDEDLEGWQLLPLFAIAMDLCSIYG